MPAEKLGINFSVLVVQGFIKIIDFGCFIPIDFACDIEDRQFGPGHPTLVMANFNLGLLTPHRNALLWSQFVVAWCNQCEILGPQIID